MPRISIENYDTVATWNGDSDLFIVEQPDGTKVATPNMVKQFIEAGNFTATGEVEDGHGNILKDMAKTINVDAIIGGFKSFYDNNCDNNFSQHFEAGFYDQTKLKMQVFPAMLSAEPYYSFGIMPAMWGKLFKRDLVIKNIDFLRSSISFGEDACFTYAVLLDCNSMYITDDNMYMYRTNLTSVTHSSSVKFLKETEELKRCLLDISLKKNWNLNSQLDEYIAFVCYDISFKILMDSTLETKQMCLLLKDYFKKNFPKKFLKNEKFKKISFSRKIKYYVLLLYKFRIARWLLTMKHGK